MLKLLLTSLAHACLAFIARGSVGAVRAPAIASVSYTQNAICTQNNCVHPVFPALLDLGRLEQMQWQCSTNAAVASYMDFCGKIVNYDPALPSPQAGSAGVTVQSLVKAQDDAAATMYFYHLNALGYEAWDHNTAGSETDSCVDSIYRMVCFTYFPKSEAGCKNAEATPYKRPCRNACSNYVQACSVDCCDESVACVVSLKSSSTNATSALAQSGYHGDLGPSAQCTGAARRTAASPNMFLALFLIGIACVLQGCAFDVPTHALGNWHAKRNYLTSYEYILPGQPGSTGALNSCVTNISSALQCSGHGLCRTFRRDSVQANPLSFCECDRDYADPECRTRRKSQLTTFLLSLFGGMFGMDAFYLGFIGKGIAKLATLGGFGFWWLFDVVRTGSGPVYAAAGFRVANDLAHWVYVFATMGVLSMLGFYIAFQAIYMERQRKRKEALLKHLDEDTTHIGTPSMGFGSRPMPTFSGGFTGYGAMIPTTLPGRSQVSGQAPGSFSGGPSGVPYGRRFS